MNGHQRSWHPPTRSGRMVGGDFGRIRAGLTLAIMTTTALVVAALLFALVMLRRRDFGRRRALGASQQWIIGFVLTQTS